jgi:uncharacterized protein (DUF2267 family)
VWFHPSLFKMDARSRVTITGRSRIAPCPACGGVGHIPEGVYSLNSFRLEDPVEFAIVVNALTELREIVKRGASKADVEKAITAKYPFLESIKKYLPKTAAELAAYLALLVAIVQCSASQHTAPPQQVQIDVQVQSALERVASDLKTTPPKSPGRHTAPPKHKDR